VTNLSGTITNTFTPNGYGFSDDELEVAFDADGFSAGLGTNEMTLVSGNIGGGAGDNAIADVNTDSVAYTVDFTSGAVLLNPPGLFGEFLSGAYSANGSGLVPVASTYSLLPVFDQQNYDSGTTSTFDVNVTVPDSGSTAALFGVALLALCLARRRQLCAAL
jgi:hypothetical protein